jgi:hypothetical protein
MLKFGATAIGATLVGLLLAPGDSFAYSGEQLAKHAKVTIEQARTIALQTRAGTITDEELERREKRQRSSLFVRHQEQWRCL